MLRDYQKKLVEQCFKILLDKKIVYLAGAMRIGKTLIALEVAKQINAKNVLFLTKKMAIDSIKFDYKLGGFEYKITVLNYEQAKKLKPIYDFIIIDEAHNLGAYPVPSQRTKFIKRLVRDNYLMLLSGTPSPESYSQLYHQFWISDNSPFWHRNFYQWAKEFVNIKQKYVGIIQYNDYSEAKQDKIMAVLDNYFVRFTQQEAGFKHSEVSETIKIVQMATETIYIARKLLKDRFMFIPFGEKDAIICDSAVKLQNKLHQIYSGTVIGERRAYIFDYSKALYIKNHYSGQKIAVYYKYKQEGEMLQQILRDVTFNPDEFRHTNKIFISQIQAGGMGIDLSTADILIFLNIDFSATLYWQARARLQALNRERVPEVHWLFSNGGIESKIYKVVQKKKNYTLSFFKRDFLNNGISRSKDTSQNFKMVETAGNLFD